MVFGDGPERHTVLAQIEDQRLSESIDAPGFAPAQEVEGRLRRALCLLFPSAREGYGIIVAEAAAAGTPTIIVAGPDNAAAELVEDGVNGFVARTADARELADAILRVHEAGQPLRESTSDWYRRNRSRMSLAVSIDRVAALYASLSHVDENAANEA